MERITTKDLDNMVERINRITKSPLTPYTKHADDSFTPNAHNYHLDWAYGGVCLIRMGSNGGGVSQISTTGFTTKRKLHEWMSAYANGLLAS